MDDSAKLVGWPVVGDPQPSDGLGDEPVSSTTTTTGSLLTGTDSFRMEVRSSAAIGVEGRDEGCRDGVSSKSVCTIVPSGLLIDAVPLPP
jgi:hypothetical protein